ncbi:MAG: hypothetical protein ABI346_05125 [Candidatus Baltobacteraceae bacterium]
MDFYSFMLAFNTAALVLFSATLAWRWKRLAQERRPVTLAIIALFISGALFAGSHKFGQHTPWAFAAVVAQIVLSVGAVIVLVRSENWCRPHR